MNDGRRLPIRLHEKILKSILREKGFYHLTSNFVLSEEFILRNADYIHDDCVWAHIVLHQRHIHPNFFDQFRADMNPRALIILDYKKSVRNLEITLERLK